MEPIFLIHNAARHYCLNGIANWKKRYAELCATGGNQVTKSDGSWEYTAEAYAIFPRYEVLEAILAEIETFSPTDFRSISEASALLAAAADTAETQFTRFDNEIALVSANDERRNFRTLVNSIRLDQCVKLPILPFRRVLTEQQHKQLHYALRSVWGNWYGGCADSKSPPANTTLHIAAMADPNSYTNLRTALIDHGINRVFELREWGCGYELAVELGGFTYTGAEGFWTAGDLSWMVYASHESSITFGGSWLIEQMRAALPSFNVYIYKGWDIAAYGIENGQ
jgi:hypothetical protein